MAELKIAIAGAAGRMGLALARAAAANNGIVVAAAFDRPGSPSLGQDIGTAAGIGALGVTITDDADAALSQAEAVLDFTAPELTVALVQRAAAAGLVHIIGTTGLSDADGEAIRRAAAAGARVVRSGNYSLGVNVLQALVKQAAAVLGESFDIEIVEMHHGKKVDAPSGTALMLGEAAAAGLGVDLTANAVRGRDGLTGARPKGVIGFASLRGGTVVGDHTAIFAGDAERIELTHRAESRAIFANGALRAARWAHEQPPGLYSMADVLGFNDQESN